MPNHTNSGSRRLLARASVTGLEVPVRRTPYRYGFLPTGPQWFCSSCRRRRTNTGQSTCLEVAPADIPKQGAVPRGITNAEKLQLSVFLPNELFLEDWYAGVYGLPTVWPEVSMTGADHLRKVAGYDFYDLRRKYDVRTMWGDLDPQWRLLQSHLVARGPDWYSPAELKERLFTNKSKRPRDDLKEALRTDDDTLAWQAWHVAHDLIWQCCRPGPPLVFPGEKELIRAMYDQIGKEEQVISLHTLVLRLMHL